MKRLFLSIILSVIAALFLINYGVDKLAESEQNNIQQIAENNEMTLYKSILNSVSNLLSTKKAQQLPQYIIELAEQFQLPISIEKTENMVLPTSLQLQLTREGSLLLGSSENAYFLKTIPNHKNLLLKLPLLPQIDNSGSNLLLTSLLYIGVCGLIILWLLPLTHRLYLLTNAAAKIGEGELNIRLPYSKFSYIQPLEQSFNQMVGKIETLVSDNKLLARSLSHDIRTPLACLRFGIEAAMDANTVEDKNQYIERMDTEITRMENMTAAFLEYAALERKALKLKLQKTSINQLIKNLVHEMDPIAKQKNIQLITQYLATDINLTIDPHWYHLALQNIVSNGIQYGQHHVFITLTSTDEQVTITIEDDGHGVAPEDIKSIFYPFIRLDKKTGREEEHFGLGLATTARVVAWHNGSISANNSTNTSGLCCTLIQAI